MDDNALAFKKNILKERVTQVAYQKAVETPSDPKHEIMNKPKVNPLLKQDKPLV